MQSTMHVEHLQLHCQRKTERVGAVMPPAWQKRGIAAMIAKWLCDHLSVSVLMMMI